MHKFSCGGCDGCKDARHIELPSVAHGPFRRRACEAEERRGCVVHRMEPELLRWLGIEIGRSKVRAVRAHVINYPRWFRTDYCTFHLTWRRRCSCSFRVLSSPQQQLLLLLLLNFGIINGIIHDWVAEVCEMDSDLVCSSRDGLAEHTAGFSVIREAEHSEFGFCTRPHSHTIAISCRHRARSA